MLLKEVRIKNFRSLKDICIPLNRNTVLIGENNSGKTTFLDAIRIGLIKSKRHISPFDEYDYFSENINENPKDSEGIIIDFIFQEQNPNEWSDSLKRSLGDIVQFFPINNDDIINTIWLRVKSFYSEVEKDFLIVTEFLNLKGETLSPKLQSSKVYSDFVEKIPLFYLQALRDIKDVFSPNSPLWGRFLKKINVPKDKMQEIQSSLQAINDNLIQNDDSMGELVNSLEEIQNVLSFSQDKVVSINALPLRTWDLLSKSQVVLKARGGNVNLPLDRHGQGTQSLAIIFLFEAYIDILLKSTYSKDSEAILTLEEPEAHLHPQAIRALAHEIKKINCQKIITTHSPYFFQNLDLLDIRVFKKKGVETKVYYLRESVEINIDENTEALSNFVNRNPDRYSYNELSKKLIANSPIEGYDQGNLRGIYKKSKYKDEIDSFIDKTQYIIDKEERNILSSFMQKTRGEILFARAWLLAEGQTEHILLPYFAEKLGMFLDEHGISFIDYQNNGSPGAFVKLAKCLDYPWILLSDNDEQGINTIKQIKKLGYEDEELKEILFTLTEIDFETYLSVEGFLTDYEDILGDKLNELSVQREEIPRFVQNIVLLIKGKTEEEIIDIVKENDKIPELIIGKSMDKILKELKNEDTNIIIKHIKDQYADPIAITIISDYDDFITQYVKDNSVEKVKESLDGKSLNDISKMIKTVYASQVAELIKEKCQGRIKDVIEGKQSNKLVEVLKIDAIDKIKDIIKTIYAKDITNAIYNKTLAEIQEIAIHTYSVEVAKLIKKDKVKYASELVDHLESNGFNGDRVPNMIRELLKGCADKANE